MSPPPPSRTGVPLLQSPHVSTPLRQLTRAALSRALSESETRRDQLQRALDDARRRMASGTVTAAEKTELLRAVSQTLRDLVQTHRHIAALTSRLQSLPPF